MNKAKWYIAPIFLLALSGLLMTKSYDLVVEGQKNISKYECSAKYVGAAQSSGMPLTSEDMITAKHIFEGLAAKHGLTNFVVYAENGIATIYANTLTDEDKKKALYNFDGLMGFLTSVPNLPYQMEYETLCVGMECQHGFDLTIRMLDAVQS